MTTTRKWRRTALTRPDGSLVPDDWCLEDERIGTMARIYKSGPQSGMWFWSVQVDAQGRPWNSGTGCEPTGAEAKGQVEAIIAGFDCE